MPNFSLPLCLLRLRVVWNATSEPMCEAMHAQRVRIHHYQQDHPAYKYSGTKLMPHFLRAERTCARAITHLLLALFLFTVLLGVVIPTTAADQDELNALEREIKLLTLERDVLKLRAEIATEEEKLKPKPDPQPTIMITNATATCDISSFAIGICAGQANCTLAVTDTLCGSSDTLADQTQRLVINYRCGADGEPKRIAALRV